jgi:hypothetical protein
MPDLNFYRDECYAASASRGWWDLLDEKMNQTYAAAVKIALIHSEITEALEGIRTGAPDIHLPHRPSGEVELADALIRIFDLAGAMNYDLDGAYTEKRNYNKSRADHSKENRTKVGGKRF